MIFILVNCIKCWLFTSTFDKFICFTTNFYLRKTKVKRDPHAQTWSLFCFLSILKNTLIIFYYIFQINYANGWYWYMKKFQLHFKTANCLVYFLFWYQNNLSFELEGEMHLFMHCLIINWLALSQKSLIYILQDVE